MKRPHNSRATAAVAIAAAAVDSLPEVIDISPRCGKDFPWCRTTGLQWDVMEFAERMNWDK